MPTHRSTGLCSGCIGLWRWIMAAIDVGTVTKLTRALPGQVFTEADEKYQDALDSAVWNGAIRRRPGVIAQPRTTAEVGVRRGPHWTPLPPNTVWRSPEASSATRALPD